ncbi:NmrA-like family protein [Colletotrichum truncatum]|uniref:NmrA-like family protein n=1 Tax=Colletotrichum truncatum TaxID=5467 RepID=A0ACC3YR41_COLTU|nr:NmrA-like family protein [Colletotrichum truncatum]KAF6799102.1 NmrA-like family protein [Colletotrichum truncatum]
MVNIAVAGGTGDVGRTIVEVISSNPKNKIFTLSRKVKINPAPKGDNSVIIVDYSSVDDLKRALEVYEIDVVISCLALIDEATSHAEINLIRAANGSSKTTRMISSLWSIPSPPEYVPNFPFTIVTCIWIEELKKTTLEYTRIINGHFSDYYGYPFVKSHLKHADFLIDIANKTAVIPGTGDDKVAFTYSFDVAHYVDALVSTDIQWPKESKIIGDILTVNELVQMAEEARGQKFTIYRDSIENLHAFQPTELPSHADAYKLFPKLMLQMMFAVLSQWITQGLFDISLDGSLNRLFSHIKTKSVREIIKEAW